MTTLPLSADFETAIADDARLDLAASLFCFVLKGAIRADLPEGATAELQAGDALHAFDRPPSAFSNPHPLSARLICVRDVEHIKTKAAS